MKIALVGYGKMGKAIEEVAIQRGHEIALKIDFENIADLVPEKLKGVDVAIEFTSPHSAWENLEKLRAAGVPVVCGSTGWLDKWQETEQAFREKGALVYASNYSIGVNLFFELNKKLAALMAPYPEYSVALKEIHHTQKKDSPSGTAVTLAEQVIDNLPAKKHWVNEASSAPEVVSILSERIDPAPGTHHVRYTSAIDDIEIIHTAHNRKGFASGAVLAAEFIVGRQGVFGMKEVLGL